MKRQESPSPPSPIWKNTLISKKTVNDCTDKVLEIIDKLEAIKDDSKFDDRIREVRKNHPRAYEAWTEDEDLALKHLSEKGLDNILISDALKRQISSIESRIKKYASQHEQSISANPENVSVGLVSVGCALNNMYNIAWKHTDGHQQSDLSFYNFSDCKKPNQTIKKRLGISNDDLVGDTHDTFQRICKDLEDIEVILTFDESQRQILKRYIPKKLIVNICAFYQLLCPGKGVSLDSIWAYLLMDKRKSSIGNPKNTIELIDAIIIDIINTLKTLQPEYSSAILRYLSESSIEELNWFGKWICEVAKSSHWSNKSISSMSHLEIGNFLLGNLLPLAKRRLSEDAENKKNSSRTLKSISDTAIESHLEKIRKSIKGEDRPGQLAYAKSVANNLKNGGVFFEEAGTGTGKTFGYLIPIMEWLSMNPGEQVIIATNTKTLQDRISFVDIPTLKELVSEFGRLSHVNYKGIKNYSCWQTLVSSSFDYKHSTPTEQLAFLTDLIISLNYLSSDRDTPVNQISQFAETLEKNGAQSFNIRRSEFVAPETCSSRSRSKSACGISLVRNAVSDANIIVTNHHKAVRSVSDPYLESAIALVVDEADHFSDSARGALSIEINTQELHTAIKSFTGTSKRSFLRSTLTNSGNASSIDDYFNLFKQYKVSNLTFKNQIDSALGITQKNNSHKFNLSDGSNRGLQNEMTNALNTFKTSLEAVKSKCETALENFEIKKADKRNYFERIVDSSSTLINECASFLEALKSSNTTMSWHKFNIHWALTSTPIHIGDLLYNDLLSKQRCTIFTSATLSLTDSKDATFFNWQTCKSIDWMFEKDKTIDVSHNTFKSPFEYQKQGLLILPKDAPEYKYDGFGFDVWIKYVSSVIVNSAIACSGRTLVLCNSRTDMEKLYLATYDFLLEADLYPLIQPNHGSSQAEMELFKSIEESVLFGVDRFWYGVDFPGPTLQCLIIPRMPNMPRNSDIFQGYRRLVGASESEVYYQSKAELKFKQGIGRLIRTKKDKGVVILPDSRFKKKWAEHFFHSLPPMPEKHPEDMNEVVSVIKNHLK